MHLTPNMYKIVTWKANAKKIVTWKYIWCQICTNSLLERQMLRKSSHENAFDTTYVQNRYFADKCKKNHYVKMHVAPHMFKTITLKANAEKIITWKCIWCQICTNSLLERQMLRKSSCLNVFNTKYVQNCYFAGKCSENRYFKMHVAPHMFKTITLKANVKDISTLKCIWHQICTKSLLWRQMLRKLLLENACGTTYVQNCYFEGNCKENHYFKMHVTPDMYKIATLQANAKEIVTWKCVWHQICTKLLLWR